MNYFRDTWRNWIKWLAVVVVFAVACGFLSNWQFNRRAEKVERISRVLANFELAAVPIDKLLPTLESWSPELEWRAVEVSGHYLTAKSLLIRNRPNHGSPGFEQLVPFETSTGNVLLVARGWLPTGNEQDSPDINPLPTENDRTIVIRLRPSENPDSRTAPTGQAPNIEVSRIAKQLELEDAYLNTYGRAYDDSTGEGGLTPMEKPTTDEGNNFSYALQWILFGVMAFVALFWMIRQERDQALGRVRTKVRKKPSDEEVEDSLS